MPWTRRHCRRCRWLTATASSSSRATNNGRSVLLDDDLAVHPRMRRADVIIVARLVEGDRLRLAFRQRAGVPIALLKRRRRVGEIADIGEGYRGPCLDPGTAGPIGIFDVVVADLDRVDAVRDRPRWPGDALRRGRRPQRTQLPLQ